MELKIATYNCHNFKNSISDIRELCATHDVIFLQETWLMDYELPLLSKVNDNFYYKGFSSMNTDSALIRGRPHGGIAILWTKRLGQECKPVTFGNDATLIGLEVTISDVLYLFLNIYMPFCCSDNLSDFLLKLHRIDSIITTAGTPYVFIAGDFNADITRDHVFGRKLEKFCDDNGLIISDTVLLKDSFTFVSSAHQSMSWLDHIICTKSAHPFLTHCQVLYGLLASDHFPLSFKIFVNYEDSPPAVPRIGESMKSSSIRVKWDSLSQQEIQQYTNSTKDELDKICENDTLKQCTDSQCQSGDHRRAIDTLYKDLCSCLLTASEKLLQPKTNCYNQLPEWDTCCKEAHRLAREAFLLWRRQGSPRQGVLYENMRRARAQFKLSLRKCKKSTEKKSLDNLALNFLTKDSRRFWKDVNKIGGTNLQGVASDIGGASGSDGICSMWQTYYSELLNSASDTSQREGFSTMLHHVETVDGISSSQIEAAICKLNRNSSPGSDHLSGEHLIFAHRRVNDLLCILFNSMISHNYLPQQYMDTLITPILKSTKGDVTSCDNYRPISVTCVMSKLLEIIFLQKYEHLLSTNDHQFGFKRNHSTDECVFLLKELIDFYSSSGSPIYLCFLDASKAFDRINHQLLFCKLLERGVPTAVVRLLSTWYCNQTMFIKWRDQVSQPFHVTNGVRQGGILSPVLFNLYLEELSDKLRETPAGCFIDQVCFNHLFYADDAVLLAPSPSALQTLISVCGDYGCSHEMMYNPTKTVCMCYLPLCLRNCTLPSLFLKGAKLKWVPEHKYLGVHISAMSGDAKDMKRQISYIYAKGNILIRKFFQCCDDIKVLLFKSYCYSLYCSHLWSKYTVNQLRKVKTAYNDVFRTLFYIDRRCHISPFYMKYTLDNFDVLLRKTIVNFYRRLCISNNRLIKTVIMSAHFLNSSHLYKEWSRRIF